jgi:hypothetical protein
MNTAKNIFSIISFAILVISCSSQLSPEDEIKEYITNVTGHFEERQALKLKGYISADYRDNHHYTRKDLLRFAAGYIFHHPAIHINSKIKELDFSEDNSKARVRIDTVVSAQPLNENDIRLSRGEVHRFLIDLGKTDEWQLLSLEWQKASIEDYLDD